MAKKITFADLIKKVQSRKIKASEVTRFFVLDAARTTGLHPRFRINQNEVDVSGLAGAATDAGHALAVEAGFAVKEAEALAGPIPDGSIIAEGDSWFRLPHILYPPTLADFLSAEYPVTNLAHWGDELGKMYNDGKGQYVPFLKTTSVKFLLFSGGGNDVLGDTFEQCLNVFNIDHADPADAAYYLTPFFYNKLVEVQQYYELILDQVHRFSPGTVLVVHGYDYAIPRGNGPLLGIHMQNRGLYPAFREELCRAIVRLAIDLFNERLAFLEQHYPNFRYVDLRGTVGVNEWYDGEIHPDAAAAERLARRVAEVLGPPSPGPMVVASSNGRRGATKTTRTQKAREIA